MGGYEHPAAILRGSPPRGGEHLRMTAVFACGTVGRMCESGRVTPATSFRLVAVATASAEHRVDVVLRGVAGIAGEFRAVEQAGVADALVDWAGRMRLDGIDAAPDIHHHGNVVLDELHRRHHLADALAGKILKIARLEDRDHALLDFLAEQPLLVRRGDPG